MDDIYLRIIQECSRIGINGNELGKMLALKKSPLTDWKNGKSKPTLEQLIKMCDIFAVSADSLLFGCTGSLNATELDMIAKYQLLSLDDKDEIIAIIELKLQRAAKHSEVKSKLSPSTAESDNNIVAV